MSTTTNKQALREAAEKVTALNLDTAQEVRKHDDEYIECPTCCGDGHIEVETDYCNIDGAALGVLFYGIGEHHGLAEQYFRAANPATVLALLDELEAAGELVELQRFRLERQAEDLHQAKSLESIHREKRFEVEKEFRDYKERADSNSMRLAKEVCRLEDELHAAGITVKWE